MDDTSTAEPRDISKVIYVSASTDERKLTLAVMKVISRAGVTQWVALSALSTNVAGVVASIDQLPPKGVDSVAKLFARKTAKLAHQFKNSEKAARH